MDNRYIRDTEIVSDEELTHALDEARDIISGMGPGGDKVLALLELLVTRHRETARVFNGHSHPVHGVRTESDEYYSSGSGHTTTPAAAGGYGCTHNQQIGNKPFFETVADDDDQEYRYMDLDDVSPEGDYKDMP